MFITRIRPILLFSTGEGGGGGIEGLAPETAPETAADTSVEETGTTTEQPQIPEGYIPRTDYEKLEARQKEAQGWGTRLSQENATLREQAAVLEAWNSGDSAKQQWAAEQLGIQLQEDDDPLTDDGTEQQKYADVDPSVLQRLEAFEAYQTQQEQAQQQHQFHVAVQAEYDPLIKEMGVPDQFVDAVREAALNMNLVPSPQGDRLDIESAWTGIKDFLSLGQHVPDIQKQMLESYRKTKRAPTVASGGAGTQVPSLDSNEARTRFMMDRLAQQD